ncbi:uncharacterized protein LOC121378223 [Gigantopelta aegis]|uniref:uncharacterized protein LOC121378223 n=1 Tax=Gigantopelta aegis TaxID=1735272 RepID=UPI001B88DA92|nr:uncharacterized protein LOC121378223 [Gigantopelta aegis]
MKLLVVFAALLTVCCVQGFLLSSACSSDGDCFNGDGCCERHFLGLANKCRQKMFEHDDCRLESAGGTCQNQCIKGLACVDQSTIHPNRHGFVCMKAPAVPTVTAPAN